MNVLIYRYGSICEPAIIQTFQKNGLSVIEIDLEISNKNISSSQRIEVVHTHITNYRPLFVFSINFFPPIADTCRIHNILYLCWTVDSPVMELFSNSIKHTTNRIFLFDRAQYNYFSPYNPECIFHLPLACNTVHFNSIINNLLPSDHIKYKHEISFVGSLYTEKNPLHNIAFSPYNKGYIDGLVNVLSKIYGCDLLEELIPDSLLEDFSNKIFTNFDALITNPNKYIIAHEYIGMQIAEKERLDTLNALGKFFPIDLYTFSNTDLLHGVNIHSGVNSLTDMPKVFHLSKINLNMTIKPIQTGLPLRIFDIMGCGGFLMTNYQEELEEHFEIGQDLEAYASLDELIEKCDFYLKHDNLRNQIALNGYNKVHNYHTYQHRITEMLRIIVG